MIKLSRPPCPNPVGLETDYKIKVNKQALMNSCFNKCMYCESKINHIDHGDVEHIKPKSKFPQLKYDWDNLGLACTKCNQKYKRDLYHDDFIDPYKDDPEAYLKAHGGVVFPINANSRGETSIDFLKLNRTALLERRSDRIEKIRPLITKYHQSDDTDKSEAILEQIIEESNNDKEFSMCIKSLIKQEGLI